MRRKKDDNSILLFLLLLLLFIKPKSKTINPVINNQILSNVGLNNTESESDEILEINSDVFLANMSHGLFS